MKKLVLMAAVTMASASAFASQARLGALQSAAHLTDVQDIISKPDQAVVLPEFAMINFGNRDSATQEAQGSFTKKMDGAAWGLYLGNRPDSNAYRAFDGTLLKMENGVNVIYAADAGDMKWGVGAFYSKSDKKRPSGANDSFKQEATGLYGSLSSTAGWDAQLAIGLSNNAEYNVTASSTNVKMKGNTTAVLSGGYWMDTMYLYGNYTMGGAKLDNGTSTTYDRKDTSMTVGVVNSHKKDGTDFFYGIGLKMVTKKEDATTPLAGSLGANVSKQEITTLPAIAGIEHDAMSWLTIRGSITQNVLYSTEKYTAVNGGTNDGTNTVDDNTVVAAGLGLKFNKFMLDGQFAKAADTNGGFGSDSNFLINTALTYTF